MNAHPILGIFVGITLAGCAHAAPKELVAAREDYRRASTGDAATLVPAQVHLANTALMKAEKSFDDDGDNYRTRDLAYVAGRKAQLAEAYAEIAGEHRTEARANADFQNTQGDIVDNTKSALAASEQRGSATAAELADSQTARAAADARASEAQAALAKLAAVSQDTRGTVITLSGSVLFASNQATLLPQARVKLQQVAAVLMQSRERSLTVEGFTDSKGSDAHNLALSQRRADAVRTALVEQGYEGDLVVARGMGEANPVADNGKAEGRANNRRVEIIIGPETPAPTK